MSSSMSDGMGWRSRAKTGRGVFDQSSIWYWTAIDELATSNA